MVLTGLLGRSLRPRVRLPFGLPLIPRRAPRVAELVLCALRFAVEVVGPVVTTIKNDSPKLLSSFKLYVEPVLGQLLGGAQEKVLSGHEEVKMIERPEPRPRIFNMHRAKEAVQRLAKE